MKKYFVYIATAFSIAAVATPLITNAQADVNVSATQTVAPLPTGAPDGARKAMLEAERIAKERMLKNGGQPLPGGMGSTTRPLNPTNPIRYKELPLGSKDMPMRGSSTTPIRQEIRDDIMNWREGSSTRPLPPFLTPLIKRLASTTMMDLKERLQEYRQDRKEARLDIFAAKQNFLVEQLTRALDNLKQIRRRSISSRIDKASSEGRDMTGAKNLLVTADASLTTAGTAIQALADYTPPAAATVNVQASTTVELDRPRVIGADAIKAVTDARKALNDVVRAIAQALGLPYNQ